MALRKGFFYTFMWFALAAVGYAQTGGQLSLSTGTLTAGDSLQAALTFDKAANCGTTARVYFQVGSADQFWIDGATVPGQTGVKLKGTLPRDLSGGQYRTMQGILFPCPGYSRSNQFTLPVITVTVRALPSPDQNPTSAELALSLTQKQFLDTKATQLSELDHRLTTGIEDHAADTSQLRSLLVGIVKSAEEKLDAAEPEYREHMLAAKDTSPAFFADFRAQYEALLAELRAPIPGAGARIAPFSGPHLVYVRQLVMRATGGQSDRSEDLGNTSPAIVTAVRKTINDNAAAYKYVKGSGRITFDAVLESYPSDAQIKYKKLIDDTFQDYSGHTKVEEATFELATWIFKFHRDGCADEPVVRIDPYEDSHPDVYVEFNRCHGR